MHNISYNITDGGEGYCGNHTAQHVQHRIESRIANNDTDYLVIDQDFNYLLCETEKEAAEFLDGKRKNIGPVLTQPIGYTFRKHYIWKHKKGTPVDIESIKAQILKALDIRHKKQSECTKKRSSELIAASRVAMSQMTSEATSAGTATGNGAAMDTTSPARLANTAPPFIQCATTHSLLPS